MYLDYELIKSIKLSNCYMFYCWFFESYFSLQIVAEWKNIVVYYNIIHSDVFHLLPVMRFAFL